MFQVLSCSYFVTLNVHNLEKIYNIGNHQRANYSIFQLGVYPIMDLNIINAQKPEFLKMQKETKNETKALFSIFVSMNRVIA